jgi:DNA replication protein DnaC
LNPQAVFEHFADELCGSDSRETTLRCIENKMKILGKSLSDADFQFADVPQSDEIDYHCDDDDSLPLSEEQRQALDKLLIIAQRNAIAANVVTILAPAGTGKTFVVHKAVKALKLAGLKSLCVAASCLASTLLPNGQTAHQALKIPLCCDDHSYCNWSQELRRKLKAVSVIFWDEVSM